MRALVLVAVFVAAMCPAAAAVEHGRVLTVVGNLEDAVLVPMGFPIQAKMDTGANTTSINALDIRRYRSGLSDEVGRPLRPGVCSRI